jgi:ABC-type branched-subunit amino acid transport system substrate-binding protein
VPGPVTGSYLFFPGDLKILQAVGIPYFGGTGDTPDEAVNPISFPIPTQASEDYGLAALLAKAGNKSVSIANGTPSSKQAQLNVDAALERLGKPAIAIVSADPGQPDYSAAVSTAVGENPTALMSFEALPDIPKVLSAIKQSGFSKPIALVAGTLSPAILKAVGSSADGVEVASGVMPVSNTANPYVEAFLAAMKKYQPSAEVDGFSETGYAVVELFAKVAGTVNGAITPASLIRAGNAVTTPINVGLVAPWRGGGPAPIASEPRFKSYGYVPSVVKNGVIVAQGTFVDPFAQ